MKFILFLFILPILFCSACVSNKKELSVINRAETLLMTNPDSAYCLLNSITFPSQLDDKSFAHWCMLSGKVADRLHKEMPYDSYLLKAQTWYERYGTLSEGVQLSLYLGRSYVENKKYDEAMSVYMRALKLAKDSKEYNLAGYICSYMADLFEFNGALDQSRSKYQEGADYFLRADNYRSYALALRDVSYVFCLQDSFDLALQSLLVADSIVFLLKDSVALSSIANALGNVYSLMDSLDYAEYCLLKSLRLNKAETAPTYLALSTLFMNNGELNKAKSYLESSKIQTENDYTPLGILYQYYLLEKLQGDSDKALLYLESYCQSYDSISVAQNDMKVLEIEKKFNYSQLVNENNQLRINQLYSICCIVLIGGGCLFLAFLFQVKSKRDKEKVYYQQKQLDIKEKKLLQLIADLDKKEIKLNKQENVLMQNANQKDIQELINVQEFESEHQKEEIVRTKNEINFLRNKILFSIPIVKKIVKLSQVVLPGSSRSPITVRDWQLLISNINNIYFLFYEKLEKKGFKENSSEMNYCYLSLLRLDKKQEAVLLHISPDSVSKLRFRVRQRLQISGEKISVYEYLLDM